MVEGGVREGSGDVRVFDGPEVSKPPEVKSRVRKRRVWEGEVSRDRMKGIGSGSAHCGARSKRERR